MFNFGYTYLKTLQLLFSKLRSVESAAHTFLYGETMRMNDLLYLEAWNYSGSFINTLEYKRCCH